MYCGVLCGGTYYCTNYCTLTGIHTYIMTSDESRQFEGFISQKLIPKNETIKGNKKKRKLLKC